MESPKKKFNILFSSKRLPLNRRSTEYIIFSKSHSVQRNPPVRGKQLTVTSSKDSIAVAEGTSIKSRTLSSQIYISIIHKSHLCEADNVWKDEFQILEWLVSHRRVKLL